KRDGQCDGAGACRLYPPLATCGPATCNGNVVSGQVCDGFGTCALNTVGGDCAPYLCVTGGCTIPCGDSTQCQTGNYCDLGTCKPKNPLGTACTAPEQCQLGFCVEGVCCNSACTGICQTCVAAHKASGADGTCGNAKDGADPHNDCADQGGSTCQND